MTAGAWDLAPQWREQLGDGGKIVLPLSVRGIQLSAAFSRAGTGPWVSESARRCQFIRMTGRSAGPESVVPLGPQPGLHALVADGPAPEAGPLYAALSGRATEESAGLRVDGIAELADLDLWLALTEPGLTRVNLMGRHEGRASAAQQRIASLMPLGGYTRVGSSGELEVAALAVPPGPSEHGSLAMAITGYGAGSGALARYLAERAAEWNALGRPGAASLKLSAYPTGTVPHAPEGAIDHPAAQCRAGRGMVGELAERGARWNQTTSSSHGRYAAVPMRSFRWSDVMRPPFTDTWPAGRDGRQPMTCWRKCGFARSRHGRLRLRIRRRASSPPPMPRRCSEFRRERRGAGFIGRGPRCAGRSSATPIQTR